MASIPKGCIYILNCQHGYLGSKGTYDDERRNIGTGQPDRWQIVPDGDAFIIREFDRLEPLYAASNYYYAYDSERRRVFTWRPGCNVTQGRWYITEAGSDRFYLQNTQHGEYLYAADYPPPTGGGICTECYLANVGRGVFQSLREGKDNVLKVAVLASAETIDRTIDARNQSCSHSKAKYSVFTWRRNPDTRINNPKFQWKFQSVY